MRLEQGREEVKAQQVVNDLLKKEVIELQQGKDAIETHARKRLGMIGEHEVFIQLLELQPSSVPAPIPDPETLSIQENPLPINPIQP